MAKFVGDLSVGTGKVTQRFIGEMIYGIQASQSVMLTEIGRTLEEEIPLKKTQERLSRNLQRPELESGIQDNILRLAAERVSEETLLILDPSDITKKYARKMEYLAWVRDGSEKELARGYWTVHVVGAEVDSEEIVPLYQRLYSAEAPGFTSENEELLRAIDAVRTHVNNRGIWVVDRGGDRIHLFEPVLDRELRFLIRLVGNRDLLTGNQKRLASEIARECHCPYAATVVKMEKGKEKRYTLQFGYGKVRLPGREEPLCLLVVKGFGEEPLLLLTNLPLRRSFKAVWRVVRMYLRRWAVEETIRYVKTTYDLENVRVLNYPGLQNLLPLVLAVMYFAAVILDTEAKLKVMAGYVLMAAKRVFGIPDFKYYAIADGLRSLFQRHPGRPRRIYRPPDDQLHLFTAGAT
jgi:hypothetical protein